MPRSNGYRFTLRLPAAAVGDIVITWLFEVVVGDIEVVIRSVLRITGIASHTGVSGIRGFHRLINRITGVFDIPFVRYLHQFGIRYAIRKTVDPAVPHTNAIKPVCPEYLRAFCLESVQVCL